jgi:HAD superfamily hydrolase (TIGR01484 family)
MQPLKALPSDIARQIAFVLSDLDDTLTLEGRLPAVSYAGLERLAQDGKKIVIVTGRPAGWCDMIARFWPVDGVVGENGAFYFRYVRDENRMVRTFLHDDETRAKDRVTLAGFFEELRKVHPQLKLASDQAFRISDIAIDICEDVDPLSKEVVQDVVKRLEGMGATVKVSSIHINAWIGKFDKLSMIERFLQDEFGIGTVVAREVVLYAGDSPNDEPMFAAFTHTVGVANIENFAAEMTHLPAYVTRGEGGLGFLEIAQALAAASAPALMAQRERSRRSSLPRRR